MNHPNNLNDIISMATSHPTTRVFQQSRIQITEHNLARNTYIFHFVTECGNAYRIILYTEEKPL